VDDITVEVKKKVRNINFFSGSGKKTFTGCRCYGKPIGLAFTLRTVQQLQLAV
jgi:hypothetical protein